MGYHLRDEAAGGPREEGCATTSARTPRAGVGYGYRYYSAELGRWVNRDPIAEVAFRDLLLTRQNQHALRMPQRFDSPLNSVSPLLYTTMMNNPAGRIDVLGLLCCCADAQRELVRVMAEARRWNRTSPGWSPRYQCFEQAHALLEHLHRQNYTCWMFFIKGGGRWGWDGTWFVYGNHHVVGALPQIIDSDACSLREMTIDAFKGTRIFLQDPNRAGQVWLGSGDEFRERYPYNPMN